MKIRNFVSRFMFAWILGVIVLLVGWVMNIMTIGHQIHDPLTSMILLRGVGIFVFPLGGILGYI